MQGPIFPNLKLVSIILGEKGGQENCRAQLTPQLQLSWAHLTPTTHPTHLESVRLKLKLTKFWFCIEQVRSSRCLSSL